MARITPLHGSAKDAHNYYLADYYDAGPEFKGQWLGQGAKLLGLQGEVDSRDFIDVLENVNPQTGKKLSARNRDNRRRGWDVQFSAPKEVSIVFGLNDDHDIVTAMREATNETLEEMEQDVMRRVNLAGGKQRHEKTGNFISAVWVHPDARAVTGHTPDPQLHTHAFVSNHTHDSEKNRWLAADISDIFRDAQGYYEWAFQNRLAGKIGELGYHVERTDGGFRIVGVSEELKEKFSKRSGQINQKVAEGYADQLAAKLGISVTDAKGMVGALSRNAKDKSYEFDQLQQLWRDQLTSEEERQLELVAESKQQPSPKREKLITAAMAVDYALEHGFEHESVLRERSVLRDALRYGIVDNSVEDIRSELATRDLIREGQDAEAILTTKDIQQEELRILNFAKHGRGEVRPSNAGYTPEAGTLSDEQRKAIKGLLTSPNRLGLVVGKAGVGKSFSLSHLVPGIDDAGMPYAIMAPTNKAKDSLREDGFDAGTIQSFLLDEKAQKAVKNGVIIVDEFGLVGSPTARALVEVAQRQNARIIGVGDDKQHLPIERGHPMKMLMENAGIKPEQITEIRRQGGKYKDAVEALSRGDIAEGFQQLKKLSYVHEIVEDRDQALAKAFADHREKHPEQKRLAIAATHAERRKVSQAIRDELKSRDLIRGNEHTLTTYVSKQLSKAEQQDPLKYQVGDLLAFHAKGKRGIQAGDQLKVTEVSKDKVVTEGGKVVPLDSAGGFSVYRPVTNSYAAGDMIRLTRGRRQEPGRKKLTNGSLHQIKSIRGSVVTLDNGEKLGDDYRFWDSGFVVTSHVSQGTTVHQCYVAASSLSFPASSPESMYVSASRAKKRVDIYTDSVDGLEQAISRYRPKQLAISVKTEQEATKQKSGFAKAVNRVKSIAHQFATKQLQRFHDLLPGPEMRQELQR